MSTDGLVFRLAAPADRPAVMALWRRVFGDDDAFITRCLDDFAGPGGVYVAAGGGGVAANLLAAPCRLGECKGVYLYALATDPQRRAGGVMTRLMAHAEGVSAAAGARFAALVPASPPLFGYYQKRGYEVPVALRFVTLAEADLCPDAEGDRPGAEAGAGDAADAVLAQLPTPAGLAALRARWPAPGGETVGFGEGAMALICEDMAESGARLLSSPAGYAVAMDGPAADRTLVPELAAANDAAAEKLVAAACRLFGRGAAEVSLPAASPLWAGRGQTRAAALLKPLGAGIPAQGLYLRFALDVVPDSFDPQNPALPG